MAASSRRGGGLKAFLCSAADARLFLLCSRQHADAPNWVLVVANIFIVIHMVMAWQARSGHSMRSGPLLTVPQPVRMASVWLSGACRCGRSPPLRLSKATSKPA